MATENIVDKGEKVAEIGDISKMRSGEEGHAVGESTGDGICLCRLGISIGVEGLVRR